MEKKSRRKARYSAAIIAALLVLFALSERVAAENGGGATPEDRAPRIAVIDTVHVVSNYEAYRDLVQEKERHFAPNKQTLRREADRLTGEWSRLENDPRPPNDPSLFQERGRHRKAVIVYQKATQALQQEMSTYGREEMLLIRKEVVLAIEKVRAGRYDLVLDYCAPTSQMWPEAVVTCDSRLEITDQIIEMLNNQYRKGRPFKKEITAAETAPAASPKPDSTTRPAPTAKSTKKPTEKPRSKRKRRGAKK